MFWAGFEKQAGVANKVVKKLTKADAAKQIRVPIEKVKKLPDGRWGVKVPKKTRR